MGHKKSRSLCMICSSFYAITYVNRAISPSSHGNDENGAE